MHHDCIHAIGHGERFEVGFDGHRERQFVNEVHLRAGDNRTAAQILEAENWRTGKVNLYVMNVCHVRYRQMWDICFSIWLSRMCMHDLKMKTKPCQKNGCQFLS